MVKDLSLSGMTLKKNRQKIENKMIVLNKTFFRRRKTNKARKKGVAGASEGRNNVVCYVSRFPPPALNLSLLHVPPSHSLLFFLIDPSESNQRIYGFPIVIGTVV